MLIQPRTTRFQSDPLSENNAYEFDKTQPNYRQTYPYRDETVGRSRGDF